jgi:hypothetical protein
LILADHGKSVIAVGARHYAHKLLAEYVRILEKVREMRNLAPFQIEFGNSVPI